LPREGERERERESGRRRRGHIPGRVITAGKNRYNNDSLQKREASEKEKERGSAVTRENEGREEGWIGDGGGGRR